MSDNENKHNSELVKHHPKQKIKFSNQNHEP